MSNRNDRLWFCAAAICGLCLVAFLLDNIVLHPSHLLGDLVGDGAKNSFTYLYQCLYGHGYWFRGMNYPYGEHIVYADGQPALSVPLSYIHGLTVGEALTAMWRLIALSYFLCFIFIYKILRHFGVQAVVAILFSGLITVFSPQLFKLQGIYGLSYACVIPMLFYWTIRYDERPHWRYPFYIYVLTCMATLLHPYYLGMLLVWTLAFTIGCLVVRRGNFPLRIRHTLPLIASAVLTLATVAVIMKATDPVTDRPMSPYNIFDVACSHINELTTSEYSPLWLDSKGKPRFHFVGRTTEGYAYTGIVVIIIVGLCLLAWLYGLIRKKNLPSFTGDTKFPALWLVMALVAMLVSMGIPFTWHMEWLFNYFSFFRQFRCLGRFIWIYYYIITVFAVVVLYRVFARCIAGRRLIAGYALLIAALGVWGYEAKGYVHFSRQLSRDGITYYDYLFSRHAQSWPSFLQDNHFSATDFQAIMVLPFFEIGTEKLWLSDPTWLITVGSMASLQLHLPMVDAQMSRSSWSVAMKQVKIAGGPYTEKPMLADITNTKPFLLLHYERMPLNPDQQYLLQSSTYIGHCGLCQVYACYPARIAANDKMNADSIARILPLMQQGDTIIANDGAVFLNHYGEGRGHPHLFGSGGGPVIQNEDSVICNIPVTTAPKDSALYEFSCWFLESNRDFKMPVITLQSVNEAGKIVASTDVRADQSTDNRGLWFRASGYFYVQRDVKNIQCVLDNKLTHTYLGMDELQLRPAGALVISRDVNGNVLVNNHFYNAVGSR